MSASGDLAHATQPGDDHRGIYSVSFENDIVTGADNNYTNGVRFSYISPEGDVPDWLDNSSRLVPFFPAKGHKRWTISAGQSIYTPDNILTLTPSPTDQPYAGWLYATAGVTSDTGRTLDTFELTLGMVGPASGAEHTQKFIHDAMGADHPHGWHEQLKNEPGIILAYDHKWRGLYRSSADGWGADLTPSAGFQLGNIFTEANVSLIARFGHDLPEDYGPPLIRPSVSGSTFFIPTDDFGWYLFAGVEGHAVARNIFLDGNSFRDSPSVDKEIFVGGVQGGIAVTYRDTRISYTHVLRSKEFETQTSDNQYGAFTVSVGF